MLFYIALLFILISEVNTNKDDKGMEQFRIIGGQRFKKMLEGRDTDCFRSWMQNADVRCKTVNKINYRNLTAQLVACEAEKDQRKMVNCSKVSSTISRTFPTIGCISRMSRRAGDRIRRIIFTNQRLS